VLRSTTKIIKKMDALKTAGQDTTAEYGKLGAQIKTVTDDGGRQVGVLQQGWDKFKSFVVGLGTTIAATFAIRNLVDFAKSSIEMANEQEKNWALYDQTLKNVGTSLSAMQKEVSDAVTYVQTHSVFDDDAAVAGLRSLTLATGDAKLALAALPVAMELASAKNISLEDASQVLGKALEGNVGALQRMGITIDQNQPILEQLRVKLAGISEREMATFGGQIEIMNRGWDDFKKAIGGALVEAGQDSGVLQTINGYLQQGIEWVNQHKDAIAGWAKVFVDFVVVGIERFASMIAGTAADIKALSFAIEGIALAGQESWAKFLAAMAGFAIKMDEIEVKILEGAAKVAEFLGLTTVAENLRKSADDVKNQITELSTFQRDELEKVDQAANAMEANRRAYNAASADAIKTHAVEEGAAIGTETGKGVDTANSHLDRFGAKYVEVLGMSADMKQFWETDLPAQIDQATAQAETNWKSWADDVTTYLNQEEPGAGGRGGGRAVQGDRPDEREGAAGARKSHPAGAGEAPDHPGRHQRHRGAEAGCIR
jgi:hypothetical protein